MKKKLIAVIVCIILILSTVGCTKQDSKLEKVTVILDYITNTNHTGLYIAKNKGYYSDLGLDVRIIEPTEGATATLVATGKGEFGISYQEDVTYALTAQEPLPIKAIAAIIQHNTSGFTSLKAKGIKTPKDFEGKKYGGWGSPSESAIISAVMKNAGADFSKLTIITSGDISFSALEDRLDFMWAFYAWDVLQAKNKGFDMEYMPLRDLDSRLDYYTPVIISSENVLSNNPEMVKKFLKATAMGYQYAIDNPDNAAEILHQYIPEYDLEVLKESQQYLANEYISDAEKWGVMKSETWDNYTAFMLENELISKNLESSRAFTNEFLP